MGALLEYCLVQSGKVVARTGPGRCRILVVFPGIAASHLPVASSSFRRSDRDSKNIVDAYKTLSLAASGVIRRAGPSSQSLRVSRRNLATTSHSVPGDTRAYLRYGGAAALAVLVSLFGLLLA